MDVGYVQLVHEKWIKCRHREVGKIWTNESVLSRAHSTLIAILVSPWAIPMGLNSRAKVTQTVITDLDKGPSNNKVWAYSIHCWIHLSEITRNGERSQVAEGRSEADLSTTPMSHFLYQEILVNCKTNVDLHNSVHMAARELEWVGKFSTLLWHVWLINWSVIYF